MNLTRVLTQILDDPGLPEKIRAMAPSQLHALIERVGLEDSGVLIAFATPEQIERIFDEDLWRPEGTGQDERFDPSRFGLWLEILLEGGASVAADKVAEMDEDMVTMGLSQLLWVAELELLHEECEVDPRLEKQMASSLSYEVEGYFLFAKDSIGWDAVLTLVTELDSRHFEFLRRILARCAGQFASLSDERDGVYEVLSAAEQLAEDVADQREKRRERLGFVPPAEARSFLKLCQGPQDIPDHVSPMRLRAGLSRIEAAVREPLPALQNSRYARVREYLEDSGDRTLRFEELAYLANVLMTGWHWGGRTPQVGRAMEIALSACERGLQRDSTAASFLDAFRAGWSGGANGID